MARDKLITIRIEGEKRDLFNQLAKSQNTDTASLLYDFISGCLSGQIDVGIVKGKKQWIDKIDNQIDSERIDNRLDKLETTTQKIDNWILAFDDRLTDCDQGLSEKITSLEDRLNALAIQLNSQRIDAIIDSQKDSQQIDRIDNRIDTDSQRIADMEPLLKRERESSIASPIPTGEPSPMNKPGEGGNANTPEVPPSPPSPPLPPVTDAIETVTGEPDSTVETGEDAIKLTNKEKAAILGIHASNLTKWIKNQEIPEKYLNKCRFNGDKSKIILT